MAGKVPGIVMLPTVVRERRQYKGKFKGQGSINLGGVVGGKLWSYREGADWLTIVTWILPGEVGIQANDYQHGVSTSQTHTSYFM